MIAFIRSLSTLAQNVSGMPTAPKERLSETIEKLRAGKDVDAAEAAVESASGVMTSFASDEALYVAYALAVERTRPGYSLTEYWEDLFELFPQNSTALRLTMRWYRRDRMVPVGLARLHHWLPDARSDVRQAKLALAGLAELNATELMGRIAMECLTAHPRRDDLRLAFIRLLAKQAKYMLAQQHVEALDKPDALSERDANSLAEITQKAARQAEFCSTAEADIVATVIETIARRVPASRSEGRPGLISFFTGSLGQGGAELQMTRIAAALHHADTAILKSDVDFKSVTCDVVVRSARVDRNDGFFLPTLEAADVPVLSLVDCDTPAGHEIAADDPVIGKLLDMLPEPIAETTLKLTRHYRRIGPAVAYLWQDGAVLDGCIAALAAGVPAIVASFRGLPPGTRPELNRPHMKEAFRALSKLPNVVFTANSQIVATAYENWLELEKNSVKVIFNAAPVLTSTGSEDDEALWRDIVARSGDCEQTVLGIFRHDQNKRPHLWIEIADIALRRLPNVRFVILGDGMDFVVSKKLVAHKGLKNRVFMPGVRRNVGYYLSRSDLLMHVSLMEGLPNALLEAHTAGLPVLTTPAGGAGEVVSHGVSGHVLEPQDPLSAEEAADILCAMLSDPEKLRTMGEAATKRIAKPFGLNLILKRTLDVFAGALEAQPRPGQTTTLSAPSEVP